MKKNSLVLATLIFAGINTHAAEISKLELDPGIYSCSGDFKTLKSVEVVEDDGDGETISLRFDELTETYTLPASLVGRIFTDRTAKRRLIVMTENSFVYSIYPSAGPFESICQKSE